ncbi:MAG: hypothetical protein M0R03_03445 [Novosphingobium sp.]|nr:hypothetical protein [Novosphingobium sp.]
MSNLNLSEFDKSSLEIDKAFEESSPDKVVSSLKTSFQKREEELKTLLSNKDLSRDLRQEYKLELKVLKNALSQI